MSESIRRDIAIQILCALISYDVERATKYRRTYVRLAYQWADDIMLHEKVEKDSDGEQFGKFENNNDWSCISGFVNHKWNEQGVECVRCSKLNRNISRTRMYKRIHK